MPKTHFDKGILTYLNCPIIIPINNQAVFENSGVSCLSLFDSGSFIIILSYLYL